MALAKVVDGRTAGGRRARATVLGLRWWLPVLLAAAVVIGSLTSLTALAVDRSAEAVSGQVDARAQDATTAARAFVRGRVVLLEQLVSAYAEQPQVQASVASGAVQPGPGPLTTALHQLQSSAPGLVAAWASDERGTILTTDTGTAQTIGQDLSYRDWFTGAVGSQEPHLSPGYVNRNAAQTSGFAVSVAVRGSGEPDAPVVGVLGISLSLESFQAVFTDAAPAGGSLVVTDQLGQVLASPGLSQPLLTDLSDDDGIREAIAGRTSLHRDPDWVTVHAPLGRGWTVSTSLPASLASEPNRQLAAALTAAGAGVGACLLGALLVLARVLRSRAAAQRRLAAAVDEVQERRRFTDTVLDTLDVAVAVCDADGALTYMNRLGRVWHGIDELAPDPGAARWSARYHATHVGGSLVDAGAWPLVRAIRTREPADAELLLRAHGQEPRRIVVLARPLLAADGTVLGAVSGAHDVTTMRRQEAELEQARDAALAASQAKTSFLAAMSHEIRTPLNGVLGMLDLVLFDGSLPDPHRSRLKVAASSGRTLLRLLNDVLDMSRGDAVRLTLARRATDLGDLVESATAVLSAPAEAKGLDLRVVLAPGLPETAMTDPDRLTQILLNLVGNAVKFTDHGTVTVTASIGSTVAGVDGGGRARQLLLLAVADSGPGMSAQECSRIFRPFEQGAAGRVSGGTGLGLALTSQLVELFGGTIAVQSRPGHGSTFIVQLPLELSAPQPHRAVEPASVSLPPASDERLPPLHVLVAEDNHVNQLVMEHTLRALGVTVDLVADGAQALDRLLSGARYDAVFLDWQMPVMDGPEVARALRAAGSTVPLIGLTARTSPDDVRACLNAGMDHVLPKPCPLPDLTRALRDLTAGPHRATAAS